MTYTLKLLLVLFCFTSIQLAEAQISVGKRHIGTSKKFNKGTLENFKKTTTIFVLSSVMEAKDYEEILNKSWTVTPYKIVSFDEFNITSYPDNNHSFALLEGYKTDMKKNGLTQYSYLHTYVDIFMHDGDRIQEKLSKLKKNDAEKISNIFEKNRINIARFELFPQDEFIATALTQKTSEAVKSMYTKNIFNNYEKGFLVNYFQRINNAIESDEILWMYDSFAEDELKKLATQTLYIPDYVKSIYNPWKGLDNQNEEPEAIFEKYAYNYQYLDNEALNEKIMNGEDIYYLRYVRVNASKFVHVVSALTGKTIYQEYYSGMSFSYNLKSKNIKELSREIKRASK